MDYTNQPTNRSCGTMTRIFIIVLLVVGLSACSKWDLDTDWKSGAFRLITIDARSEMSLIHEDTPGFLVGATIFAVGADEKHIVLMQHPNRSGAARFDRSITHYFVVSRDKTVRGPLTKEEFDSASIALSLPPFTKVFDDLK